jgi:hypothetical protein
MSTKCFGSCATVLSLLALAADCARAAEQAPDFSKLALVPPCASLVAAAATNHIPLERIDPLGEAGKLNPGDGFTGLITLCEKGGRHTQWLLYLQALPAASNTPARKASAPMIVYSGRGTKFEYAPASAVVRLQTFGPFSPAGDKRTSTKSRAMDVQFPLNRGFLGLGLEHAAAAIHRLEQAKAKGGLWFGETPPTAAQKAEAVKLAEQLQVTTDEERAVGGLAPALISYLEVIQHTEGLEAIMLKVIEKPSVWSVLRHVGVTADLMVDSKHISPMDAAGWRVPENPPAYDFPMLLELNHQLALTVTFVVTSPRPPLLACGGIIGLLAEKPGDPETYLTLRVISARSAQPPASAGAQP